MFRHIGISRARQSNKNILWRTFSSFRVDLDTGAVLKGKETMFQTIIGMEIHAQLDIPTKLFSNAPRRTSSHTPNSAVHPFDVAVPGTLPVISGEAVKAAVLTAAACNCEVPKVSRFERKHYSYADLPLGYQITQQRWPLAVNGELKSRRRVQPGKKKKKNSSEEMIVVGIDRIQIEQDTGKTTAVARKEVSSPFGYALLYYYVLKKICGLTLSLILIVR